MKFKQLNDQEIEYYINTKEFVDKAGSYAVQGIASIFIEKIEGDYLNIVGLPLAKLYEIFKNETEFDLIKEEV